MKKTAGFLIFFILAFSSMIYFIFSGNDISIGFARERGVFNQTDGEYTDNSSLAERSGDRAGYVTIPLPDDFGEENVTVSKNHSGRRITVNISPVEQDFYHKNLFSGEMKRITNIKYGFEEGTASIVFESEEIVEPVTEIRDDKLFIKFVSPRDIYDHILVIDPGHGGDDSGTTAYGKAEKDIVNGVVEKLHKTLSSDDIGIYYTREKDTNLSDEERLSFINSVSADLVVSIHVGADSKSRTTTGITALSLSADRALAEAFSSNIAEKCSEKDAGWKDGTNISLMRNLNSKTIMLELGYITNKKEALLMSEDAYMEKASEALAETIKEYFANENN